MPNYKQGEAPWEVGPNAPQKQDVAMLPQGSFKQGSAPWEQAQIVSPEDPVINEMHPDISFGTRLLLKNLSNSPEASQKYIEKTYPGMQTRVQSGEVQMKRPGESAWRPLDPTGFDPQDITDVGYDVGAGALSGAAGAGAAVLAAPTAVGSLPAAVGASAATSAGLEGLRQKLGNYFGIPQEVSGKDVAMSGAVGAVSPLIFGTGATAAQLAEKGLAGEGLSSAIQAQKGISRVLPKVAEFMSGVPAEATKTLANKGPELDQLAESGISSISENAHDELKSGLAKYKDKVGAQLGAEIKGTKNTIDISGAKDAVDSHIAKLESSETAKNPLVQQQIQDLKEARNNIFQEVSGVNPETGEKILTEMPNDVSAQKAFEIQHLLGEYAQLSKMKPGLTPRMGPTATSADKQWANANSAAYKDINEQLDSATSGLSTKLKTDYRNYTNLQKNLNAHFSDPDKTYKSLSSLDTPGKKYVKETLEKLKDGTNGEVDILPEAKLLQAYKYYNNPSMAPISSGGTTSTSRSLSLGALGGMLGYKIGGYPGSAIGYGAGNIVSSPMAMKQYTKVLSGVGQVAAPLSPYANQLGISGWNMKGGSNGR